MGRPLAQIDAEQVFKLAQLGCTYKEIGQKFGVDESTVRKRFSVEKELGDASGKTAIRRWQMKRAKAGSDNMLALLGKARLGQTERLDLTSDGQSVQPIFRRIDNARDEGIRPTATSNGVCGEHG